MNLHSFSHLFLEHGCFSDAHIWRTAARWRHRKLHTALYGRRKRRRRQWLMHRSGSCTLSKRRGSWQRHARVCVCESVCVCLSLSECVDVCVWRCVYIYVHACVHVCVCVCECVCERESVCVCVRECVCVSVFMGNYSSLTCSVYWLDILRAGILVINSSFASDLEVHVYIHCYAHLFHAHTDKQTPKHANTHTHTHTHTHLFVML